MTITDQNTRRPVSAFGSTDVIQRGGIGASEVGNADFHGNDGQHTTASDRFEMWGVVG